VRGPIGAIFAEPSGLTVVTIPSTITGRSDVRVSSFSWRRYNTPCTVRQLMSDFSPSERWPMSRSEIEAAIPHRPPMLLVDEIVVREESRIVCRKTFRAEEFFFQGHYPGRPIVPGVVLCEASMQAGAILLSKMLEGVEGVPVATRLDEVKFKRVVRPGDTIEMEVTLKERLQNAFFLSAKVTCQGSVAAKLEFACTLAVVRD
jgi:3-hydroxyacyl-[acyl-carrier-protein] dehydratase